MDNTYNPEKIGERLRKERKDAGLSEDKLIAMINDNYIVYCDRKKLIEWEKGRKFPPLNVLCFLCKIYDCDLGYLLCEYDCKTRPKTDIAEQTGLSESAINNLMFLKSTSANKFNESLETINALLSNLDFLINLSNDIDNYFSKHEKYESAQKSLKRLPTPKNETDSLKNALQLTEQLDGQNIEQLNQEQQTALWTATHHFTNIIEQIAKEQNE